MDINYSSQEHHQAINQNPSASTGVWHMQGGSRITLRPVLPQDGPLLGAMIARLSPASKRNRCHGAVNEFSAARLRQMTCVDHKYHVAFVVTAYDNNQQERVIADARYVVDEQGRSDSAEFAIVVDDQWVRQGLGERCMNALMTRAAHDGLRWLHGDVLVQNRPMLALMKRCQFFCTPDRHDGDVIHAEILLSTIQDPCSKTTNSWLKKLSSWRKHLNTQIHLWPQGDAYANHI